MNKRESQVISAVTGILCTKSFSDMHEYVEEIMQRPVWTHEFADKEFIRKVKAKAFPEFEKIICNITE